MLGGGSWGTTVGSIVCRNAEVCLWARNSETVEEINRDHRNEKYLPGATLPYRLQATNDIEQAVAGKDVVVVGVPSQSFRRVVELARPHIGARVPIVSLSKGLELSTRMRMSEIIGDVLPDNPVGVLTGPNLAREIITGSAAATVIAMQDKDIIIELQMLFQSGLFRVYTNPDLVGCELGGVLKNIVAIAAGMGDGLGAGDNTRAALITRGLAEIARLGVAMGGRQETFAGLAGLGDLVATCTSVKSRNHTVGYELGKGRSIGEITRDMYMVAEGVKSAPAVMDLAETHKIDMPIAREVYNVVTGQSQAKHAYRGLIRIEAGAESQPG